LIVRNYYVEIGVLPRDEGGGFIGRVLDLPGCMSDGDTIEELETNVGDAIECWIAAARREGRPVPEPAQIRGQRA
jgi:predicted RNase H-like HicB family nuclease